MICQFSSTYPIQVSCTYPFCHRARGQVNLGPVSSISGLACIACLWNVGSSWNPWREQGKDKNSPQEDHSQVVEPRAVYRLNFYIHKSQLRSHSSQSKPRTGKVAWIYWCKQVSLPILNNMSCWLLGCDVQLVFPKFPSDSVAVLYNITQLHPRLPLKYQLVWSK